MRTTERFEIILKIINTLDWDTDTTDIIHSLCEKRLAVRLYRFLSNLPNTNKGYWALLTISSLLSKDAVIAREAVFDAQIYEPDTLPTLLASREYLIELNRPKLVGVLEKQMRFLFEEMYTRGKIKVV